MHPCKRFRILVEAWGEGVSIRRLRRFRSFDSRLRPLAHDDRLRRGEFPPRQANSGLVGGPRFCAAQLESMDGIAVIGKPNPHDGDAENSQGWRVETGYPLTTQTSTAMPTTIR